MERKQDTQENASRYGSLVKIMATAGIVLCIDLIFCACSSGKENTETMELTMVSDANDSLLQDEEEEDAVEDGEEEEAKEEDPIEEDEEALIYVYVSGAVQNPGVYQLAEGSRVFEAVEEAGGFTEEADESYVNQALILEDEDQLFIPTLQETMALEEGEYGVLSADESQATAQQEETSTLVNINEASAEELMTLSGIGETKAASIIAYREENGAFSSIEEIQNVSGIGEATFANLKDYITVD